MIAKYTLHSFAKDIRENLFWVAAWLCSVGALAYFGSTVAIEPGPPGNVMFFKPPIHGLIGNFVYISGALLLLRLIVGEQPREGDAVWRTRPGGWLPVFSSKVIWALGFATIVSAAQVYTDLAQGAGDIGIRFARLSLSNIGWAMTAVMILGFARSFRMGLGLLAGLLLVLSQLGFSGAHQWQLQFAGFVVLVSSVVAVFTWMGAKRTYWIGGGLLLIMIGYFVFLISGGRMLREQREIKLDWDKGAVKEGGMNLGVAVSSLKIPLRIKELAKPHGIQFSRSGQIDFALKSGNPLHVDSFGFRKVDDGRDAPRQILELGNIPVLEYFPDFAGKEARIKGQISGLVYKTKQVREFPLEEGVELSRGTHHRTVLTQVVYDEHGVWIRLETRLFASPASGFGNDWVAAGLAVNNISVAVVPKGGEGEFEWQMTSGWGGCSMASGGKIRIQNHRFNPYLGYDHSEPSISFEGAKIRVGFPELDGHISLEFEDQQVRLPARVIDPTGYGDPGTEF